MSVGAEEGRERGRFRLIVRCSALALAVVLIAGETWAWWNNSSGTNPLAGKVIDKITVTHVTAAIPRAAGGMR